MFFIQHLLPEPSTTFQQIGIGYTGMKRMMGKKDKEKIK